jgi:hypothetical protein
MILPDQGPARPGIMIGARDYARFILFVNSNFAS